MKSLAASNRHLRSAAARNRAVEQNVRSSSAIEGVSGSVFRSAVSGQFMTKAKGASHAVVVKEPRPRKKK